MEKYTHARIFDVGFCDVDFKDQLKPSEYLARFEEVACTSADELGFGYEFLKPTGYAFMVTEIRCEIIRPVELGEKMEVVTWPNPPSFGTFGREYIVQNPKTKALKAKATSKWCMIDMKSGKILSSKLLDGQDYSTYNTDKALVVEGKIPKMSIDEGEEKFSLKIANSEYDHNMHVNNTKYADYCFNCFSVAELSTKRLKAFALAYVKQCKEGETLSFRRKDEEGKSLVCGFNEAGEIVVRSEITFE